MDETCILKSIVDVGGVKSSMYKDFSGNVFNNAVMPFTDPILMLMFGGSVSSAYFLFGGPSLKNGGFEFGASVRMDAVDDIWSKLGGEVSNKES